MAILKELLASKKFLALLAALLAWVIGKLGLDIPAADLLPVLGLIAIYIVGQGVADLGKESSKVLAAASAKASEAAAAAKVPDDPKE